MRAWLLIVSACAWVLIALPAFAQEQPDGPDDEHSTPPVQQQPAPAPIVQPNEEAERLERSGKAMVGGGAFLMALGIASELTGLGMSLYSQFADPPTCTVKGGKTVCPDDPRIPFLASGVVLGLAAGGMIYGGLAVLSAGKGRIRRAKLIKLHMSFGTQQVSAQAGFTF